MRRMSRTAAALLVVALAGGLVSIDLAPAHAAPPKDAKPSGNATFAATASPERVAPGQSGVIKLVGTVKKGVHVLADSFKVKPKEVAGVAYGKPVFKSKTQPYKDAYAPAEDAPEQVWFDRIDIELPYTLSADALPPLMVGASITYSCCDESNCYPAETTKDPVVAEVLPPTDWVRPAGAPPAVQAPAPANGTGMAADTIPAADSAKPESELKPGAEPSMTAPVPPVPGADPVPSAAAKPAADGKASEILFESDAANITVRATDSQITVTFAPKEGWHLYLPGTKDGDGIVLRGVDAEGTRWRDAMIPAIKDDQDKIVKPLDVTMAYAMSDALKTDPEFVVRWQGCSDITERCDSPIEKHVAMRHEGGKPDGALILVEVIKEKPAAGAPAAAPSSPTPAVAGAVGLPEGQLFPEIGNAKRESKIDEWWKELGFLILLPVFLAGVVLAFTPCVLPLIPITVSIIGGGAGELKRSRMVFLLCCYVAGLSLTYGAVGLFAALTGGSMAAAFQSPIALFVIAGIFFVLAFSMFGIFELQAPAFMQRLQGGAKGGSPIGALFMGALGAVIASPCTAGVIAAMGVFVAQLGNPAFGFLMFLTLGLGMGAVLFAAGALNLLAKPGPWMVWVRYAFGLMLVGAGLYYLADAEKITPRVLFVLGGVIALLCAVLIQRHLIHKEGEDSGDATRKAAGVGIACALTTLLVAMITRPHEGTLTWTKIDSTDKLVAEVAKAKKDGKPVVVDFWATWCSKCKLWDRVIEGNETLSKGFAKMSLLRVDLSLDDRPWEPGVRKALGGAAGQPYLVFFNKNGEIIGESRTAEGPSKANEKKFEDILKTMGLAK